jgi:3,4-dihydroxy 2-butanone 4-phosphate synthase
MVTENSSRYQTPFTVSIEAKKGVTTGVSVVDRITTIRTACAENAQPADLSRPGHVFPLRAKNNGILERKGHTEGSVDLMKLAHLPPEAVLCELMNADGTMSNISEIITFAEEHDLVVVAIADILHYRTFVSDYN